MKARFVPLALFLVSLLVSCSPSSKNSSNGDSEEGRTVHGVDSIPSYNVFLSNSADYTDPTSSSESQISEARHLDPGVQPRANPMYRFSNVQMGKINAEILKLYNGSLANEIEGFDGDTSDYYGVRVVPLIYDDAMARKALEKAMGNKCYKCVLDTYSGDRDQKIESFVRDFLSDQSAELFVITYKDMPVPDNLRAGQGSDPIRTRWNLSTLCPPYCPGLPISELGVVPEGCQRACSGFGY